MPRDSKPAERDFASRDRHLMAAGFPSRHSLILTGESLCVAEKDAHVVFRRGDRQLARRKPLPLRFHPLSRNAAEVAHTNIVPEYEHVYRNKKGMSTGISKRICCGNHGNPAA